MKKIKSRLSILLAAAILISSISMGFGQIKVNAYANQSGTGIFRVDIIIGANDCTNGSRGGDGAYQLRLLDASGSVISATPSNALNGASGAGDGGTNPLESGQTTSFTYNGAAFGNVNETVTSLGTLNVNKTITQVQLLCTTFADDMTADAVNVYYSPDGGTTWTQISTGSWSNTAAGQSVTWTTSYFASNYKTLTFNANGGLGGITYDAIPGQTISAPSNVTKTNYIFSGWSPAVPARMPGSNATYTALWEPTEHYITFDANGGTGGTGPTAMQFGSTLTPPTVTRTGYTFITWSPSVPSTVPGIDKTYTAVWLENGQLNENSYNIIFNANGGTGTMADQSIVFGQTAALSTNAFTRTGYTFLGWATTQAIAASGVAEYINGENYTMAASDITLFAVWSVNQYTMNFDANGGSGGSSAIMTYGETLTPPTVVKTGYTFSNWSPQVPDTVPAANATFTAQWTANTYTVTFNPQSGTVSPSSSTVTYNSTYGEGTGGFPTPTRTGYTFGGWYTGTNGSGTRVLETTAVAITSAQTLYAKWTAVTYTVAYDGNGSTSGSTASSSHTYDTAKALTVNGYTKTGYAFEGWATSVDGPVAYSDGQSVINLADTNTNVTLYVKWTNTDVYTITFDANGGTGGKSTLMVAGATLTAPTVTKTGYTLASWSPSVPSTVPAGDSTYTAQWTARTYTVTFDAQGGTVSPSTKTVTYASTYGTLPTPTRTGYTFSGWYTSTGGAGTNILSTTTVTITAAQTLYAKWTANTYTVTFDAQGGSVSPSTTTVTYAGTYGTLPTPTKTGYTFSGWYTSTGGTGTNIVSSTTVSITAAQTLYAKWTANTYTVTFDAQSGSVSPASKTVTYASTYGTLPTPTKTGYTFDGWYTSTGGAGTNILSTTTVTITAAQILYAKWIAPQQVTITFDAGGGTGGTSSMMTPGSTLTAPAVIRTGYSFLGWSPEVPAFVPSVSTTYTAQWSANRYIIAFDANGGSGTMSIQIIAYDQTAALSLNTFTKTGYTFAGWAATPSGAAEFADGADFTMGSSDMTLYAIWEANTYTVIYDGNGPVSGYMPGSIHIYDVPQSLASNCFTRTGYSFMGWTTYPSGGVVYANGEDVLNLTIIEGGTVILYAKWFANNYTVTFDAQGGSVSPSTKAVTYASIYGTLPVSTRTGYDFDGWYTSMGGAGTNIVSTTIVTIPANQTLYAKWAVSQVTIIFDASGGTGGTSSVMTPGSTLTAPIVTKEGNSFVGWSPEVPATVPSVSTTYTAQWSVNSYTITFDANGGSSVTSITQTYGTTIMRPTDPSKTGYTFVGWYTNAELTNAVAWPYIMASSNVTFYAKWSLNTYSVVYNGNGDTGGSTASSTLTYNVSQTLTCNGFTKMGYTFIGWATSPNGSVVFEDCQSVINLSPINGAIVTLYAVWSINQYTISFNSNGGSSVSAITQDYDSYVSNPIDPIKPGYLFDGWYLNAGLTNAVMWPYTITGNATLYAKWLPTLDDSSLLALIALAEAANLPANATHDSGYMAGGALYEAAGFVNNGFYPRGMFTSSSLAALTSAVTAAKSPYSPYTQQTVDARYNELLAAYSNIELAPADYSQLNARMSTANNLDRDIYTEESLLMVDEAMNYSSDIVAATYKIVLQEWVDESTSMLGMALDGLEYLNADYSNVQDTWSNFQTNYIQDNYTSASWAAVVNYYNSIDWSLKKDSQTIVDGYNTGLIQLISSLVLKGADYTAVNDSIRSIPDNDSGLIAVDWTYLYNIYTSSSVDNLAQKVNAVVTGRYITEQSIVDGYASAITAAINALVPRNADYTYLGTALARSPTWSSTYYTSASYEAYSNACAAGQVLYSNHNLDITHQQTIDNATALINSTYAALTLKAVTYTVKYQSEDGTTLLAQVIKNATAADLVTESAPAISGYTPAQASIQQRLTGTSSENVIIFTYNEDITSNVHFAVSNVTGTVGNVITVSVVVSENSGIAAASFELPFDSSLLEYVSAIKGSILADGLTSINYNETTHKITLTYISTEPLTTGGSILNIQFRIKADAAPQTLETSLSVINLVNADYEDLSYTIAQGTIGIQSYTPGDINNDGTINVVDALMALHHVSGYRLLSGSQVLAADVDKNGLVNIIDALKILQYASGTITSF